MKNLYKGAVFAALMTTLTFDVAAEDKKKWTADASRGERLSQRLCASCHVVRPDQTSSAVAGVPSFRALADLPGQRIFSILILPHAPMPNMQLTRNEIADIVAFIDDLRRKAAGEPAKNTTPRKKPMYPSPS